MATRLTKKKRGFAKDYIETGNGVKSALANYNTQDYSTAGVIAHENLKKPKIIKVLEEAFPDELLYEVHREGLFASKPNWEQNSETKQFENVGDEPDYAVRHKYLDTAYKLKGAYPKGDEGGGNKTLILNVTGEIAKRYGLIPSDISPSTDSK